MYKTIEELVTRVDERNSDGTVSELIGVSIDKCFIKSVANTNGTDLSKYKIIRKNDFAVSLMQVSRDGKIPVARLEEYEEAIMSPAYPIFRVKDKNIILPDYLEMWFKRPEFDREAAFIAVGGVRGSMPWEEFAKMKLPVPSIEKQQKIVNAYKIVTDRIALKQRINDNFKDLHTLRIKDFGIQTTEEWAKFIMNNRSRTFTDVQDVLCNKDNKYDIVIGPVADDNMALLFRQYENEIIDFETLLKGMIYKKTSSQYSFHTENSVKLLRKVMSKNV